MRGRSTCPTGQKKNSVGTTGGSPLCSTRKGWVPNRPLIRPSVHTGAPSPRGEDFGGERRSGVVEGLFRGPCTCPDLETFFRKMLFPIFLPGKMRSKSVLGYRRKQPHYRTRNNDPKNQRVGTSGYKTGGPGGLPPALFPPAFSGESRAPPPESAGETTWQGLPCAVPNRTTHQAAGWESLRHSRFFQKPMYNPPCPGAE